MLLKDISDGEQLDVFIAHSGNEALQMGLAASDRLREKNISVDLDPASRSLASQLKKADREKARVALIIGEDEVKENRFAVKDMKTGEQKSIDSEHLVQHIASILTEE